MASTFKTKIIYVVSDNSDGSIHFFTSGTSTDDTFNYEKSGRINIELKDVESGEQYYADKIVKKVSGSRKSQFDVALKLYDNSVDQISDTQKIDENMVYLGMLGDFTTETRFNFSDASAVKNIKERIKVQTKKENGETEKDL